MNLRKAAVSLPYCPVKGLGLVALLALVWVAHVRPLHAATYCYFSEPQVITYYSDASKTKVVGTCYEGNGCYTSRCTGEQTNYETISNGVRCEICIQN
jgi:hypothetical protein